MATDDLWKREGDKEWRKKVDHLLSTLLVAHQNLTEKQNRQETILEELDEKLRGDGTPDNRGMAGMLANHDALLTRLNAVVFQDPAGEHGLVADVATLKRKDSRAQWTAANRTTLLVAVVGLAGLIVTNLQPIEHFFHDHVETIFSKMKTDTKPQKKRSVQKPRRARAVVPTPAMLPALTGETRDGASEEDVPK